MYCVGKKRRFTASLRTFSELDCRRKWSLIVIIIDTQTLRQPLQSVYSSLFEVCPRLADADVQRAVRLDSSHALLGHVPDILNIPLRLPSMEEPERRKTRPKNL